MQRITFESLVYYQFNSLQNAGVRQGIFTRMGGISTGIYASLNLSRSTGDTLAPVLENRRRMFHALGLRVEDSLTSWLVHGHHVRVVNRADIGQDDVHADAMITRERGLALTLRFADCVPIMVHDPVRQVIGIAHAGWMGIVAGILPATVLAMRDHCGSDPRDVRACIGPSIGPERFEVGEDVANKIQAAIRDPIIIHASGAAKPRVDLWRAAASQLREVGVQHIETAQICTASNTHEWFSHRAEKGRTGRFGAVIELPA
jgi:polyphenol oxidase